MQPETQREATGWLDYTEMDLEAAKALLPRVASLAPVVSFHSQQAPEKALKGLLTMRGQAFPKSHDLEALLALCSAVQPAVDAFETAAKTLTPERTGGFERRSREQKTGLSLALLPNCSSSVKLQKEHRG